MLTIIGTKRSPDIIIVGVEVGDVLYVKFIVADTVKSLAQIKRMENGSSKLTFTQDAVLVVEGLYNNHKTAKHLRFAQATRKDQELLLHINDVSKRPRLRVALRRYGVPRINVPGGLDLAVIYDGQLLVADYTMAGSHGWLIEKRDIRFFLDSLPRLKNSGQIGQVWINSSGLLENPDECVVYPVDHDPTNEPPPSHYNWRSGHWESSNHQVFRLEFDLGSLLIKRIVNQTIGQNVESVVFQVHPVPRTTSVGERLPNALRLYEK